MLSAETSSRTAESRESRTGRMGVPIRRRLAAGWTPSDRLAALLRQPLTGRWLRYAAGSVISFGVSELAFVALFAPGILGAKGAAGVASLAGMVPGYFLNRNWAWGRRGRSSMRWEVLPYWGTIALTTVLAALIVGWANGAAAGLSRDARTVTNAATYMAVYLFFFVAKFLVFNYLLFRDRGQVPTPERVLELDLR